SQRFLNYTHETIQAAEAIELFCVPQLCLVERPAQHCKRLIVSFERHGKWMPVFAAMGEAETRWIGESAAGAMRHFGNQRQGLQSARAKVFQQQQRSKIAQRALVGHPQ